MAETTADDAPAKTSFLDRVNDALNDLVEVTVVTSVGDLAVTVESKDGATETHLGKSTIRDSSLVTIVKVIDGDVTTVIGGEVQDNTELHALHAAQVAASLEVLPTHLKALVDIAKEIRDLI